MKWINKFTLEMNTKGLDVKKEMEETFEGIIRPILGCQKVESYICSVEIEVKYDFKDYNILKVFKKEQEEYIKKIQKIFDSDDQ